MSKVTIEEILEFLDTMTIKEVMELVKELEKKFGLNKEEVAS